MVTKQEFDWKKTATKGLMVVGMGALTALITFLAGVEVPVEYSVYITVGISVLKMLENFLKHKN